jgi:hypothetical protein
MVDLIVRLPIRRWGGTLETLIMLMSKLYSIIKTFAVLENDINNAGESNCAKAYCVCSLINGDT